MKANKIKILLGCVFWISGCITFSALLISAATLASTLTSWGGTSKFWYCLIGHSDATYSMCSLDAFPIWAFIVVQFIVSIALFISAYHSSKKQK